MRETLSVDALGGDGRIAAAHASSTKRPMHHPDSATSFDPEQIIALCANILHRDKALGAT